MPSASFRRKLVLLLLVTILAAPWASAAEPGHANARPAKTYVSPLGFLGRLWSFLTSAWGETGCMIDPDGRCTPEPQPTNWADEGCMIDPDGRCAS